MRILSTVRHGSTRTHTALRTQLEAAPSLLRHGTDYVLHAILDFIVDGYQPIVETIEDDVLSMEQKMLDSFLGRDQITRIFKLRREMILFQRVLGPMSEVCGKLAHIDMPCIDREAQPYFSDVLDHVRRVESMVDSLRDVLISVFDTSHLFEQQRQGAITKKLAAWAAILAIPTAIAGIYGMNFEYMPELKTRYGFDKPRMSAFIKLANAYQIIVFLPKYSELNPTTMFSVAGDHNEHRLAYEGMRTSLVLESEKMTKRSRIAIATACSAAALSVLMAPAAFAANTAQPNDTTATTAKPTMHKTTKHVKVQHVKPLHAAAHTATSPTATTTKK